MGPRRAAARGATVVEVNPQPIPRSLRAHFVLRGPSGEILPLLVNDACPEP